MMRESGSRATERGGEHRSRLLEACALSTLALAGCPRIEGGALEFDGKPVVLEDVRSHPDREAARKHPYYQELAKFMKRERFSPRIWKMVENEFSNRCVIVNSLGARTVLPVLDDDNDIRVYIAPDASVTNSGVVDAVAYDEIIHDSLDEYEKRCEKHVRRVESEKEANRVVKFVDHIKRSRTGDEAIGVAYVSYVFTSTQFGRGVVNTGTHIELDREKFLAPYSGLKLSSEGRRVHFGAAFKAVLEHELGHLDGQNHNTTNNSLMYPRIPSQDVAMISLVTIDQEGNQQSEALSEHPWSTMLPVEDDPTTHLFRTMRDFSQTPEGAIRWDTAARE